MITKKDGLKLVSWYQENYRDLPWRRTSDAYYIWISEIMLQQTRVETVIDYYNRFIEVLPTLTSLAKVSDEVLFKLWEGLGYYSRARNLKKCAQYLVERKKNTLPSSYEELLNLPGIGPYTAGAIASIAFGQKKAAIDGNVLRVFSRIFMDERDILQESVRKEYAQLISSIMIFGKTRQMTEGLIELGATICLPNGVPLCEKCPWNFICLAHQHQKEMFYPIKRKKKERKILFKTILLFVYEGQIYLHKRGEKGLLAGLNEFYLLDQIYFEVNLRLYLKKQNILYDSIQFLGQKKHLFSHEEWRMFGYCISLKEPLHFSDYFLMPLNDVFSKVAIPTVFQKYLILLKEESISF